MARRHQDLATEIARLDAVLEELLTRAAPAELLAKQGVATQVAAALLATTDDNPSRVRKEASFAALCGASPVDASPASNSVTGATAAATGRPTPRCGRSP